MIETSHTEKTIWKWIFGIIISCAGAIGLGGLIAFDQRIALLLVAILAGVLPFTWLSFQKPVIAFLLLVLFSSSESLSSIQVANGISLMVALGLVFVGVWIIRLAIHETQIVFVKEYGLVLGFVGTVILSSIANARGLADFRTAFTYLQQIILFVLVINFVNNPKKISDMGTAIVCSALFIALPILFAVIGLLPSYSFATSVSNSDTTMVARMTGFFKDPNFTGAQLILALPFTVERLQSARRRSRRVLWVAAAMVLLAAFFFTFSTGGVVALLVYVLFKAVLITPSSPFLRISRGIAVISIVFLIITQLYPTEFQIKLQKNFSILGNYVNTNDPANFTEFGTGRGEAWMAGVEAIIKSPLLGFGPGNSGDAVAYILDLPGRKSVHNMFLEIALNLGLLGFTFFITILIIALIYVMPRRGTQQKANNNLQTSKDAIFSTLIICIVVGFSINLNLLKLPWLLMAMAFATRHISKTLAVGVSRH